MQMCSSLNSQQVSVWIPEGGKTVVSKKIFVYYWNNENKKTLD